ncbi:mitotic-spindle organizing gamma-tubulin ring associated-domain-containing protein [Lobosporangium transversale]|uniref:Mitotic-spindle organizing protein 1 n=1 Tax=Lobosporangium transversale TaxID=64571 RepID=A0A1Y2H2G4_9FUNG|nr:mitotic-spindle organizing gamma-tubulin ring associated-domain-containing protein [Lobosporangium transversale]ORZ28736.1 mitotic-spindle organizing gamma-tubulin ring associated-domain-containing protein [Lobosporangium transversale]|eukprot:XP_021886409.1 mitotic-spindle organizing gamma-tubulin ring associated-domain-containing protein [Lobosporangium transversale]
MQESVRDQQQRQQQQQQEARQAMDILTEMSTLLNTGLDRETLSVCVSLCESGVNPEALAAVIKELRREAASAKTAS